MSTVEVRSHKPNADQVADIQQTKDAWIKIANEATVQGIGRLEDAAKQLIGLNSLLQGLYFSFYTFSDIRHQIQNWQVILFLLPVLFWLTSLYSAAQVFLPRIRLGVDIDDVRPDAWLIIRNVYNDAMAEKLKWL